MYLPSVGFFNTLSFSWSELLSTSYNSTVSAAQLGSVKENSPKELKVGATRESLTKNIDCS